MKLVDNRKPFALPCLQLLKKDGGSWFALHCPPLASLLPDDAVVNPEQYAISTQWQVILAEQIVEVVNLQPSPLYREGIDCGYYKVIKVQCSALAGTQVSSWISPSLRV